jgi:hypothetical protein
MTPTEAKQAARTKGITRQFAELLAQHGATLTDDSTSYGCAATLSSIKAHFNERTGGMEYDQTASVSVHKDTMPNKPRVGQYYHLRGYRWQVRSVSGHDNVCWQFQLGRKPDHSEKQSIATL